MEQLKCDFIIGLTPLCRSRVRKEGKRDLKWIDIKSKESYPNRPGRKNSTLLYTNNCQAVKSLHSEIVRCCCMSLHSVAFSNVKFPNFQWDKVPFNNYIDKMRGTKISVFVHAQGIKKMSMQGGDGCQKMAKFCPHTVFPRIVFALE